MTTGKDNDSSSKLTKRLDEQEAVSLRILDTLGKIGERLDEKGKMPTVVKPDDRIAAMKASMKGMRAGDTMEKRKTTDLLNPNAQVDGFQPDDVVIMSSDSEKYAAYQLDDDGEPVGKIFEYHCQACPKIEEYLRGPDKKLCPECHNSMLKVFTGRYEKGTPAYGVIINYMYTNKKKKRKYKVHFEKFCESLRSEGMTEDEMVLCQ